MKVEGEGGGHEQGMWTQSANDLTPNEVKSLETLVLAEIRKQPDVQIVPLAYPENCIGIAVVAAKLPKIGGGQWYVVSSALLVSTKEGTDELVTHDVIAGSDLQSVARSIAYQFVTARLRAVTGMWK